MARFLICSENPQKLQGLQFTDCFVCSGLDIYGRASVSEAAPSPIALGLVHALHGHRLLLVTSVLGDQCAQRMEAQLLGQGHAHLP